MPTNTKDFTSEQLLDAYRDAYQGFGDIPEIHAELERRLRIKEFLPQVLLIHWLHNIECLHESKQDISHCICGWRSEIQANVGLAVNAWIKHIMGYL